LSWVITTYAEYAGQGNWSVGCCPEGSQTRWCTKEEGQLQRQIADAEMAVFESKAETVSGVAIGP